MTSTTTHVEDAAAVVTENESRTHDLSERFRRARDQLSKMSAEGDSRVLSSARFIAVKATAEKLVQGLAIELEEARADLTEARAAHEVALVAAYKEALPDIVNQRHDLATKADDLLASLDEVLREIMGLTQQEITARKSAGRDGAGYIRFDRIVSGWLLSHIPALRSLRGPGSLRVYPLSRQPLGDIFTKYEETGS